MARRTYSRRNQFDGITMTEAVVGGLVLVGVVGGIIYLVTKSSSTTAAAAAPAAQGGLTAQQLGIAAGTPASYLSGTTDQYGNPVVGT